MIDIFERYAPRWRNAVARYARLVWSHKAEQKDEWQYNSQALRFAREYRHALEQYYADRDMHVYRGTLDGYVNDWLRKQEALKSNLKIMADEKQEKLVEEALAKLKDTPDAQAVIDKLFQAREDETVYKIFSFRKNFEALARKHGDENAYELGTGINERIIQQYSDRYFWKTQKDRRVRVTHQMLEGKCFLFIDPPTTIDKYGNRYTGNPGTDDGCRCFSELALEKEKVLRGYVVRESERHRR